MWPEYNYHEPRGDNYCCVYMCVCSVCLFCECMRVRCRTKPGTSIIRQLMWPCGLRWCDSSLHETLHPSLHATYMPLYDERQGQLEDLVTGPVVLILRAVLLYNIQKEETRAFVFFLQFTVGAYRSSEEPCEGACVSAHFSVPASLHLSVGLCSTLLWNWC